MPKFKLPDGSAFDIPDEWWSSAGMTGFIRAGDGYRGDGNAEFIADIADIQPPRREAHLTLDAQGLLRDKMVPILWAFVADIALPPIPLVEDRSSTHRFVATDGFHRYHASVAVGFTVVPARRGWLPEI